MKIKELQSKSKHELQTLLLEKREALLTMRFKVAQRQLKKVHDIKVAKWDVARILTLLNSNKKEKIIKQKDNK